MTTDVDANRPSALLAVPMPPKVAQLPRNPAGYPIPFFVGTTDGQRDFTVVDRVAYWACVRERLCWICGQRRRTKASAFLIGPAGVVDQSTSEPGCHLACAEYAAKACPTLTMTGALWRARGLGIGAVEPGVAAVYITHRWRGSGPDGSRPAGRQFDLGEPVAVSWWVQGRVASRDEASEALAACVPILEARCGSDDDMRALARSLARARRLLPDHPADDVVVL